MPRQDDPSKHLTIMTMKCTKLLVIAPILCLIFFRAHMVCGIFTHDLSIFLSSCHCHAHTWHRFLESAETQCYICTLYDMIFFSWSTFSLVDCKVHIFWEGHKILRNFHLTYDWRNIGQKQGEDFAKFSGLLRIYEL